MLDFLKNLFKKEEIKCSAVILAAGSSTRMGKDKVFLEVGGKSVLIRSIEAFEENSYIDEIIVVTREDRIGDVSAIIAENNFKKVKSVIAGGNTRVESSLSGVMQIREKAKLVAIHDCARPFVTQKIINETVMGAHDYYAALPVIPCTDTVKIKNDGFLGPAIDRDILCLIQTPQVFNADLIKGALTYVLKNNLAVTDDSSALAYMGYKTKIIEGDTDNIKLTVPSDIPFAEAVLKKRGEMK